MVKKSIHKSVRRKRVKTIPLAVNENIYRLLELMGGSPQRGRLAELWKNWGKIAGEELASMATPVAHKDTLLILATEDAILMQELQFRIMDILELVNGFLECEYFEKIKFQLRGYEKKVKKKSLYIPCAKPLSIKISRPAGKFLNGMDPASPVTRCYALFCGKR